MINALNHRFTRSVKLFLLFLAGCFCTAASAQDAPSHDFILSAQGHYGYIISHRNNVSHLIKGHIYGGEINYVFRTDGKQAWEQIHHYPELGVCALHLYLANPSQLGTLEALYPYTNIRLNKLKRNWKLNLRLGVGLAVITKPFNRVTNHKNNAIGSYLNGFVNLRMSYAVMLSKTWRLDAGVGLTHASNGAMATPNLGLNMATINLGIGYAIGNKDLKYIKDTIPKCIKKWHPMLIAVFGVRELEQPDGPKYMAYGAQINVYRTLNYKNRLGAGIEMAYNNTTRKYYQNDSVFNTKFRDIVTVGAKISYAFTFNKISLPVDFGYYIYNKELPFGHVFHRIGVRYMITKHLIANVTLLTHWARADYFEWGLGYEL
ncbi:MAG: hypothetical protein JWP12_3965 [Bacteroidetes bacterium]|nr:hypothetical protein [Bacteroidota bacterium]